MPEVQKFFKKHAIPLVGHRKPSNDNKRYAKRPLVVVYYGVDFSFDYRKGNVSLRFELFLQDESSCPLYSDCRTPTVDGRVPLQITNLT